MSLPVISLFVGAWLTGRTKKADVRGTMRIEAADLMADIPALLWKKGNDGDWLNVRTGLDRLRFRLCLAGLPPTVARYLVESGLQFWHALEWGEDVGPEGESGWIIYREDSADWNRVEDAVAQWLADNWRLRRQLRLWREARTWDKPKNTGPINLGEG